MTQLFTKAGPPNMGCFVAGIYPTPPFEKRAIKDLRKEGKRENDAGQINGPPPISRTVDQAPSGAAYAEMRICQRMPLLPELGITRFRNCKDIALTGLEIRDASSTFNDIRFRSVRAKIELAENPLLV